MADMEEIVYEDYKKTLEAEFAKGEMQQVVRKCVVDGSSEYKEIVESREDNPEIVEKRMLTESPILSQEKLKFDGEKLIPDWEKHKDERKRREFHKW